MSSNNKEEILYPGSPLISGELNETYYQEQNFPQGISLHYENPEPQEQKSRFGKFERPVEENDKPIREYRYKRPPEEDFDYVEPERKTAPIVSGIIIGLLVFFIGFFVFIVLSYRAEIKDLESNISSYKVEIADLESDISSLKSTNSSLQAQVNTLSDKANFMDNYIKVVEDDAYRTYHTYGCAYFDDSYFWAYNKEQVVGRSGYKRCPYCN